MKESSQRLAYLSNLEPFKIVLSFLLVISLSVEFCYSQYPFDIIGKAKIKMTIPCSTPLFSPIGRNPDFIPVSSAIPYQIVFYPKEPIKSNLKYNYILYPFGISDGFHIFGQLIKDENDLYITNNKFYYFTLKEKKSLEICIYVSQARSRLFLYNESEIRDNNYRMFEVEVENKHESDTTLRKLQIVFPKRKNINNSLKLKRKP